MALLQNGGLVTWCFGILLNGSVPLWLACPKFLLYFSSHSHQTTSIPCSITDYLNTQHNLNLLSSSCLSVSFSFSSSCWGSGGLFYPTPCSCFFDGSLRILCFSFFLLFMGMELRKEKLVRWFFSSSLVSKNVVYFIWKLCNWWVESVYRLDTMEIFNFFGDMLCFVVEKMWWDLKFLLDGNGRRLELWKFCLACNTSFLFICLVQLGKSCKRWLLQLAFVRKLSHIITKDSSLFYPCS